MKNIVTFIEKYSLLILVAITLVGGFFRFYQLATVPPALNWDEVAFGYNAYSLLHTGKDEYGASHPLYLRSLDDYKRPVYTYAAVASVALFGLNDFAVRFPSAFIGTLTIVLLYFLTLELTKKKQVALLAAFYLAITPWHIQFSHAAFEATLGFFFTGLGVLSFLWGIRRNPWFLVVAAFSFGLSLYSYLGQRIAVPILVVTLVVLFAKQLTTLSQKRNPQKLLPIALACLVIGAFFLLLVRDSFHPEGNIRYKATSIFLHTEEYDTAMHRMQVDATKHINLTRRVFHDSRKFTSMELVIRGYLTHFSPDFFFFDQGQQHHHAPGVGILYIWTLPFLVFGLYSLVRTQTPETKYLLLAWILGPPIAASVTFQIPHALRVGEMILPLMIVTALGTKAFFHWVSSVKRLLVLPVLIGFLIIGTLYVVYFFHQYFIHLSEERSRDWAYGYKEAVMYIEAHKKDVDQVIVSTNLQYPYIFFLYYSAYDPKRYLQAGGTKSGGFAEQGNAFDKYAFHTINYASDSAKGKTLFVGLPGDFPPGTNPIKTVHYLNGEDALYIVESK